jgi:hypothetical protein
MGWRSRGTSIHAPHDDDVTTKVPGPHSHQGNFRAPCRARLAGRRIEVTRE